MPAAGVEIIRIALPKPEVRERQAERIGRDLGKCRLVALAVGMRADHQIDPAVVTDAHFRHFIGLAARRFEKAGVAQATQPAPLARASPARIESRGGLDRVIDRVGKTALLDREAHRACMGKAAKDVLAPQLQRIHPELGGSNIDAALNQIVRLGLAGAAIGIDRRRVGEHAAGLKGDQRDVIDAAHGARHRHCRHGRRHRRDMGAQIGEDFCVEREKAAIAVERQASPDQAVTAMGGAGEILAAIPDPRDRAAEAARRPQHQHPFRIEHVLHPEAAADVGNADAKLFPADAKHTVGEQVTDRVCAGGRGYQVQATARGIELPQRTARLHRRGDDAVVDQLAFHDMGGVADHSFHRADLAPVELERDVAPRLRPDRRSVRQNGIRDRDHRRQRRIVDDDGLGGIARGLSAFRNHERDRLADITNDVARQCVTGRHHERRGHRDMGHRARQRPNIVGGQFGSREHSRNAGHLACHIDADRGNPRMRMRRANDDAMKRVWRHEIGDVAPASPHEALVLKAIDAAPQ